MASNNHNLEEQGEQLLDPCSPAWTAVLRYLLKRARGAELKDIVQHLKHKFRDARESRINETNFASLLDVGIHCGFLKRKGSRFMLHNIEAITESLQTSLRLNHSQLINQELPIRPEASIEQNVPDGTDLYKVIFEEAYADVVELCALLECLGFTVKTLNTGDNRTEETGTRTITIYCQASGLHVVLESNSSTCSCPPELSQQNSGFWHVSGIAGGQPLDQAFGCSVLRSLPKEHREQLSKELREMMRCIRENSDIDVEKANQAKERSASSDKASKSTSMVDVRISPETRLNLLKPDTPTHYRSLESLSGGKRDQQFPTPGFLRKKLVLTDTSADEVINDVTAKRKIMLRRQSACTVSTAESIKIKTKASSPIQQPCAAVLDSLIAVKKTASGLQHQLATTIEEFDEGKDDSSMSSLALDVSKIPLLKVTAPMKQQFASSPNLSGLGTVYKDMRKNKLLTKESTRLVPKVTPNKDGVASTLRRSPVPKVTPNKDGVASTLRRSPIAKVTPNKDGVASTLRRSPIAKVTPNKDGVASTLRRSPVPKVTPNKDGVASTLIRIPPNLN